MKPDTVIQGLSLRGSGPADLGRGDIVRDLTIDGDLTLYQTRNVRIENVRVEGVVTLDAGDRGCTFNYLSNVYSRGGYRFIRSTGNPRAFTNCNTLIGCHVWGANIGIDLESGSGNWIWCAVEGCNIGLWLKRGADVNEVHLREEGSSIASIRIDRNAMRNAIWGSWQESKLDVPTRWADHKTQWWSMGPNPYLRGRIYEE